MSGWISRDAYQPALVVLAGLLTYLGILGVGRFALRSAHIQLQGMWQDVIGVMLGVQLLSLGVQFLGITSSASRILLVAWLAVFWSAAIPQGIRVTQALRNAWLHRNDGLLMALLVATGLFINLLAACAPSSKADEIYYHMLIPSRILQDSALRFYLLSWEGAWLPQMGFQIAAALLPAQLR